MENLININNQLITLPTTVPRFLTLTVLIKTISPGKKSPEKPSPVAGRAEVQPLLKNDESRQI